MRIVTTFYVLLFSFFTLHAQYNISITTPSVGNLCTGFMLFEVPSEGGRVDVELLIVDPSNSTESLVDLRNNWTGTGYFSRLCPGDYILRFKDSFGCSKDLMATIEGECAEIKLEIQPNIFEATACKNNGAIEFNGGSPADYYFNGLENPVEFEWSNGFEGPLNKNLFPGNYQLTVTDAKYCSETFEFIVPGNLDGFSVEAFASASCSNLNSGAVDVWISSQAPAQHSFYWYHSGETEFGTVSRKEGLAPGSYQIRVSPIEESCPPIEVVVVVESLENNGPLQISLENRTPTCNNAPTGTIDFTMTGGTPPYKVQSTIGDPYLIDGRIYGLSSGNQTITFKDNCGEEITQLVVIEEREPFEVFITRKGFPDCSQEKGIIKFEASESFSIQRLGNLYVSQQDAFNPNIHYLTVGDLEPNIYDFYPENSYGCVQSIMNVNLQVPTQSSSPFTLLDPTINCMNGTAIQPFIGSSNPVSIVWRLNGQVQSTDFVMSGTPNGTYTVTVVDACLNELTSSIDFNCECSNPFTINSQDGCGSDSAQPSIFNLIKLDKDSKLKPGNYRIVWTNALDPEWQRIGRIKVDNDFDEKWTNEQEIYIPIGPHKMNVEVSDPEGCIFIFEWESSNGVHGHVTVPVPSNSHNSSLGFWTGYPEDEETVSTDCWSRILCDGFEVNSDAFGNETFPLGSVNTNTQLFNYQPSDPQFPCSGGRISCSISEGAYFEFEGNGIPYDIETGTDKCGCLWEVGSIYVTSAGPIDLNLNGRVLAVFDCDGDDITINVNLTNDTYFPNVDCEGIVSNDFDDVNCTATVSCIVDGEVVGDPVVEAFVGDYKYYIQSCDNDALEQLFIYTECSTEGSCEERVKLIEYDSSIGGGIRMTDFLKAHDENRCWTLDNIHYRQLCRDFNPYDEQSPYTDDILYEDSCSDFLNTKGQCTQFTGDPPNTFTGNETGSGIPTAIQLFPNPTSGSTTIQFAKDARETSYTVMILDVLGNPRYSQNVNQFTSTGIVSLNVAATSQFTAGVYFVQVHSNTLQEKNMAKLIVQ